VLLVHRPKYDDWSFPKGKAKAGENNTECALREVDEEVGLRCRVERELGRTHYRDWRGRPKSVVYFRLACDGEPIAGDGVDEVRWATVEEALELLTWTRDRDLLSAAHEEL
jgi:8-oxo-dGTP pyrophosphatase MutT (NUDIX family)